ncbi:MAG: DNA-binding domain-containing protein [Betaproteobacteria bacterium]
MTDLATLERAFAAALTARAGDADLSLFSAPAGTARSRMRLYRGNVQGNVRTALANAYPVCAQLVGEDFFDGLAHAYAARTPSRSGDLNEYGDAFAAFLAGFAPAVEQVPYLADVATLEWRVHLAHYAADAPQFDAATLAGVAPARLAQLRFVPAAATALVESRWPVASVWRAHGANADAVTALDVTSGGERALVFRPRYRVDVVALGAGDFAFLAAAMAGTAFGGALERALAVDPAFAPEPALRRWIAERVIAGVVLPPD